MKYISCIYSNFNILYFFKNLTNRFNSLSNYYEYIYSVWLICEKEEVEGLMLTINNLKEEIIVIVKVIEEYCLEPFSELIYLIYKHLNKCP